VTDDVAHACNFEDDNLVVPTFSQGSAEGTTFLKQKAIFPPEYQVSRAEFMQDLDPEVSAYAMFSESDVGVAVLDSVPIYDFFKGGLVFMEKGRAIKEAHPDRSVDGVCDVRGNVSLP